VDDLWAPKSEGVGLSLRAISFQDFQPIRGPDPPTSQTDRRTDRQTNRQTDDMRWQDRAMHYASRGKNG